jgi:PKD repeat protein
MRRIGIVLTILMLAPAAFADCPALTPGDVFISFTDAAATCSVTELVCRVGSPVTFTATRSGSFGCAPLTFTWNFGDGSPEDFRGQTVTHTFTSYGPFDISVKVQSPANTVVAHQLLSFAILDVFPAPPTLTVERLSALSFKFTPSASTPIENITWDFGDGFPSFTVPWRTNNTHVHQYAPDAAGTYVVTLTATTPSGGVTYTRTLVAVTSRQRAARH